MTPYHMHSIVKFSNTTGWSESGQIIVCAKGVSMIRLEKLAIKGSLLYLFLKLVQINFIYSDNIRILCIYSSVGTDMLYYIYLSL
jgi:hypothetical protein